MPFFLQGRISKNAHYNFAYFSSNAWKDEKYMSHNFCNENVDFFYTAEVFYVHLGLHGEIFVQRTEYHSSLGK